MGVGTAVTVNRSSAPAAGWRWNPLRCSGLELPVNLVIMVKAIAIALLLTRHFLLLPDPFLPFIPGMDRIPGAWFQRSMQVLMVGGAIALLFNVRIRMSSFLVGMSLLQAVVVGAVGWVAGLVNAFPDENRLLWDLATSGKYEEAVKVYRWFAPLLHLDTHVKLVQYIKLAAAECGHGSEMLRTPRLPVAGKEREEILTIIRQAIKTRKLSMLSAEAVRQACAELGASGYDPFASMGANFNYLIGTSTRDPVSGTPSHRSVLCEIRPVPSGTVPGATG